VEVIEHDGRAGQIAGNRSHVGLGHVHSDGLDAGSGRFESFPERIQRIGTFALTNEDNRPAVQIEHNRQVSMSVTNADFIDGDSPETLQGRAGKSPLEISLLDILDRVPTDSQVVSHIPHGHVPAQLQHVPLESPRVSPIRVGKGDICLPKRPTDETPQSLNAPLDQGGTQTDGQRHPGTQDGTLLLHRSTPAMGTLKRRGVLINSENRPALLEPRVHMMDSPPHYPKTVIQYTRGHDLLAFSDFSNNQRMQEIMSSFHFQPWSALTRRPTKSPGS
jgi:hypothetical protein